MQFWLKQAPPRQRHSGERGGAGPRRAGRLRYPRPMLSRAQEARVREVLGSHAPGTIQTYCLEHLATAAKIPPGHLPELAVFVRTLHERGDCQKRFGGFCDADRHETRQTLVWGPPARPVAQGMAC